MIRSYLLGWLILMPVFVVVLLVGHDISKDTAMLTIAIAYGALFIGANAKD